MSSSSLGCRTGWPDPTLQETTVFGNKNFLLLSFLMALRPIGSTSYGSAGQQEGLTAKTHTLRAATLSVPSHEILPPHAWSVFLVKAAPAARWESRLSITATLHVALAQELLLLLQL